MFGIGGIKVDNVLYAMLGDEAEVIDGEVAMGVDNAIPLVVKDVRKGEELEEATLPCSGLADDVDVAGAVATEKTIFGDTSIY